MYQNCTCIYKDGTSVAQGCPLHDTYRFIGEDDWSRRLFKHTSGRVFVDVDGMLHTITDYGEPCSNIGIPTPEIQGIISFSPVL